MHREYTKIPKNNGEGIIKRIEVWKTGTRGVCVEQLQGLFSEQTEVMSYHI